jgi:hypothetical protein
MQKVKRHQRNSQSLTSVECEDAQHSSARPFSFSMVPLYRPVTFSLYITYPCFISWCGASQGHFVNHTRPVQDLLYNSTLYMVSADVVIRVVLWSFVESLLLLLTSLPTEGCHASVFFGRLLIVGWGPEHPRIGGWSLLAVMSDWQHGVDWLLAKYCWCRLRLDSCWCIWRAGAKGLSLAGPPRSGETSKLGSMDPVAERDQMRVAWWQEKKDKVVDSSRCRVVAHDQSLHSGFAVVHHKTVGLLGWVTKPRPKTRWVKTGSGRAEKLRCRGTCGGIAGLASGEHRLRWRCSRLMKRSAT